MPSQTEAGKAFEYALFAETYRYLSGTCEVLVKEDTSFGIARSCFDLFSDNEQVKYMVAAAAAIRHIVEIEPRLGNSLMPDDVLTLRIASDAAGVKGDVRDVIFIRSAQNWEFGISAKNNHRAVKHSRLSDSIDFGREWLSLRCSDAYFSSVTPVFTELNLLREEEMLWRDIRDKQDRFYIPVLEAFKTEMMRLDREHPSLVPSSLLRYLMGNRDFYKVIKRSHKTEIYGFHLYGTLNKPANKIKPKFRVPHLKLPTRIIEFSFKPRSGNTLILTCDEGWQISFRIHSASSRVEPSLKFDINLIGQPQALYAHHIHW